MIIVALFWVGVSLLLFVLGHVAVRLIFNALRARHAAGEQAKLREEITYLERRLERLQHTNRRHKILARVAPSMTRRELSQKQDELALSIARYGVRTALTTSDKRPQSSTSSNTPTPTPKQTQTSTSRVVEKYGKPGGSKWKV